MVCEANSSLLLWAMAGCPRTGLQVLLVAVGL